MSPSSRSIDTFTFAQVRRAQVCRDSPHPSSPSALNVSCALVIPTVSVSVAVAVAVALAVPVLGVVAGCWC